MDLGLVSDAALASAVKAFRQKPTLRIRDVGRCEVLRPEHLGTEGFAWLDEDSSVFEEVDRKFRWRPRCVRRGGVYITRQGDAVYVQGLFRDALLPMAAALLLGVPGARARRLPYAAAFWADFRGLLHPLRDARLLGALRRQDSRRRARRTQENPGHEEDTMEWNFDSSAEALLETEERAARSHHVLTATLQRYGLSTEGPQEVLRARYEGLQVGRQHAALATTSEPLAVAVRAQGDASGQTAGRLWRVRFAGEGAGIGRQWQ